MILKKAFQAIRYFSIYLRSICISKRHYDYLFISSSKWMRGGRYGNFTAAGWKWVIDDYKSCKLLDVNQDVPWPCSPRVQVVCPANITFHPNDLNKLPDLWKLLSGNWQNIYWPWNLDCTKCGDYNIKS